MDCLPFKAPCVPVPVSDTGNGTIVVERCCDDFCFMVQGQERGYCTKKNCLEDGTACHTSGSMGFCCSQYCDQFLGEPQGVCADRNSNSTRAPDFRPPSTSTQTPPSTVEAIWPILLCIVTGATLLLMAVVCVYWIQSRRRKRIRLSGTDVNHFLNGAPKTGGGPQDFASRLCQFTYSELQGMIDSKPYDAAYEIVDKDFTVNHAAGLLGSGEFSIVLKAHVRGSEVAAKTVRPGVRDPEYLKALLRELKILIDVGSHENIVSLVGAYTERLRQGVCYVFIELCPNGSLYQFLKGHGHTFTFSTASKGPDVVPVPAGAYLPLPIVPGDALPSGPSLTPELLRRWSLEIATGMSHLERLNIIHGDLATRNVLLDSALVAKVSDFGLSKKLYTYTKYTRQNKDVPLPWQHMAPESLTQFTFSIQSDVWAFGVTLWEMYSLGATPYGGVEFGPDFVLSITGPNGARLGRPPYAPESVYEIMASCWASEPSKRPAFKEISARIKLEGAVVNVGVL